MEWRRQGSPYLKGPVEVELLVIRSRPQSHLLVNGVALSSEGHKYPIPPRPDCSNVLKLVEDALKRLAFGDDAEIACAFVSKAYGSPERCELVIRPWDDGATTPTLLEEEA
jgi:Holliday junction resolvase RusA-like endonuclease